MTDYEVSLRSPRHYYAGMNEPFGLYLILTAPVAGYETCARAAVDCGVRFLQLRMKNQPRETILETAQLIRKITHGTRTLFIMNDDLSLAMEADADGVHLGQTDQSLGEARAIWNHPKKRFGLSTHSMAQAAAAVQEQPDYIGIGPVFPTPTKPDADPALGPDETGRIASATPLPAVAIGGIDADNLQQVLEAGAKNYCVVRAVNQSHDPATQIKRLQKIWKSVLF